MDFPTFGDDISYQYIAQTCANSLQLADERVFEKCYDQIRPLGIIAYHTVPNLVTDNAVSRNFVMLLMNVGMLAVITTCVYLLVKQSRDFFLRDHAALSTNYFFTATFVLLLTMLVGHLPLYLSDLPSLAVFCVGLVYAFKFLQAPEAKKQKCLSIAGFALGCASLMKQNYIAYGFIAGIGICYMDITAASAVSGKDKFYLFAKRFTAFSVGFMVTFAQFFWIYAHEGVFWPYLPSKYSSIASVLRNPPFVEMIIFTTPSFTAYNTQVTNEISLFTYYLTKIYLGLFKFDITVYTGKASSPAHIAISTMQALLIYFSVFMYFIVTIVTYLRGPQALRMLSLCALGYTIFTAVSVHVEFRYYLFPRIVFYLTIIYSVHCLCAAMKTAYLRQGFGGVRRSLLGMN